MGISEATKTVNTRGLPILMANEFRVRSEVGSKFVYKIIFFTGI